MRLDKSCHCKAKGSNRYKSIKSSVTTLSDNTQIAKAEKTSSRFYRCTSPWSSQPPKTYNLSLQEAKPNDLLGLGAVPKRFAVKLIHISAPRSYMYRSFRRPANLCSIIGVMIFEMSELKLSSQSKVASM